MAYIAQLHGYLVTEATGSVRHTLLEGRWRVPSGRINVQYAGPRQYRTLFDLGRKNGQRVVGKPRKEGIAG